MNVYMKNTLVYFKALDEVYAPFVLVFNGSEIPFEAEREKSFKPENRQHIINGLNHMLEWAWDKGNTTFLNQFGVYMLQIHNNTRSKSFKDMVSERLKEEKGKDMLQVIRGEVYANVVKQVESGVLLGILDYVYENLVYNSNPNYKDKTSDASNLEELEVFIVTILIVVSKIITLGSVFLGKGQNKNFTGKAIRAILNIITNDRLSSYLYNKGLTTNMEYAQKVDLSDSIYKFLKSHTYNLMEAHMPITELHESNGQYRGDLAKDIIDTAMSVLYKIMPINVEDPKAVTYNSFKGDDYKLFKFTSKNVVNYARAALKNNHTHKNINTKHPNVVKIGNKQTEMSSSSYYKNELIIEKRDERDLKRKKEHMEMLSIYCKKYLEKNDIDSSSIIVERNPLRNYFIIKLLSEIAEDQSTLKIINMSLYSNLVLLISHRLEKDYFNLSLALMAEYTQSYTLASGQVMEYNDKIKSLSLYVLDPEKFKKAFYDITSVSYIIKNESKNAKDLGHTAVQILDSFYRFLLKEQDTPFIFIEGYLYDEVTT